MAEPPVQRRSTKRGVLERNAPEVVAMLATGEQPLAIANLYKVDRSAITHFADRHKDAIEAVGEQVAQAVEDYAIAHKVNRVAALDHVYNLMRTELDEYGLAIVEVNYHYDNEGKETGRTETRDFRGQLVREMRGVLKDAADELGQIPRPDIHVGDKTTYVLQVIGTNGHVPLG